MYCIEIPMGISKIISVLYYFGLWHRGDKATVRETRIKLFYCFYYLLFPLSTMVGAIMTDNHDESIFLAEITIAFLVVFIKLLCIIWKKDQIVEMLNRIGIYSMENSEEFTLANNKLKRFMKYVIVFIVNAFTGGYVSALAPIFVKGQELIIKIGFPLDYKNNGIAYWMANAFLLSEVTLTLITILFSVVIWYLMLNCASRYDLLGMQIKHMGERPANETTMNLKILEVEKQIFFHRDLIKSIQSHQHIRELIQQLESFFARLFFIQIVTSGLCICGSIYCLALNVSENLVERLIHLATLVYHCSDIFMIMFFGNEIKLSSDRLSYCLFESNWIDQPLKTKKCIIIFGELLKQPHELVIGYLYPLTLETFRRILNFAYNTFNILKNLH